MGEIRWLSVPEAARRLHVSRDYVRALIRSGVLPAVKAGTSRNSPYRITEHAVNTYRRQRAATHYGSEGSSAR